MSSSESAGARLGEALEAERPLQVVGVINAYCALLAGEAGFRAIYLSGAGVANASHGLPDLGVTNLADLTEDARRITAVTPLPLLVDADTGGDNPLAIGRGVRELERAGAAGIHLEDQVPAKRCGHRPGKVLVAPREMADRVDAAAQARTDPRFVLMARTDAYDVEGLAAAIERAQCYVQAGADMIFAEAIRRIEDYQAFVQAVGVPVLANLTEFGQTPLFSLADLAAAGVQLVLYPLSAFRAMSATALAVYRTIRGEGTQRSVLNRMQTREELYRILRYHEHERRLEPRP